MTIYLYAYSARRPAQTFSSPLSCASYITYISYGVPTVIGAAMANKAAQQNDTPASSESPVFANIHPSQPKWFDHKGGIESLSPEMRLAAQRDYDTYIAK